MAARILPNLAILRKRSNPLGSEVWAVLWVPYKARPMPDTKTKANTRRENLRYSQAISRLPFEPEWATLKVAGADDLGQDWVGVCNAIGKNLLEVQ